MTLVQASKAKEIVVNIACKKALILTNGQWNFFNGQGESNPSSSMSNRAIALTDLGVDWWGLFVP